MNADPTSDARPTSRTNLWPALFAGLVVVINGIALAILYADTTMRLDGKPSPEMIREGFITMTQLNILLGAFGLVSIWLTGRKNRAPVANN
jgi:hypothetical protein